MSNSGVRPTLLLVEDDVLVADSLAASLEEAGYAVRAFHEAEPAIEALEAAPEGVLALVTDIRLPGALDGWEIARRAREIVSELPVIYMSGDSAGDWSAQGVPRSVMLAKPFASSQLIVALGTLINQAD